MGVIRWDALLGARSHGDYAPPHRRSPAYAGRVQLEADTLSDLFREIPIPRPLNACQSETPLGGNPCEFGLGADTSLLHTSLDKSRRSCGKRRSWRRSEAVQRPFLQARRPATVRRPARPVLNVQLLPNR
jgi:hypothetical protein